MALTYSIMKELGSSAPPFDLPAANPSADGLSGDRRSLDQYDAAALVIVFTCNHCPFAKHVEDALIRSAAAWADKDVQFVLISANDARGYPEDSFDAMAARAAAKGYPFPYLYDESQEVAKAYGAVCTPDLFVYDRDRKLVYRGRYDETRPDMGVATGKDLHDALDLLLSSGEVLAEQVPSIGCDIKWKPGNRPA
ncbi:MAG: thioredoxin family protein [Bacteroidetes bacterium SB0662_bin_6]|nr:thioredoxin family protein [Bacteroidetes bacterium SB0668_bin_1]MYE03612.1 thioredoxin family protein [Bacteroidetes bacterium SB0662_bin_6]